MPRKVGDGVTCHKDMPDPSCKTCKKRLYMRTWIEKNRKAAQSHGRKSQQLRQADVVKHDKDLQRSREWRMQHPREMKDYKLQWYHGISLELYEKMLQEQEYKCAICFTDTPRGQGSFHVDHDHDTGKIRGLLCAVCNVTLRFLVQRPGIQERVEQYLLRGKR